MVPAHISKCFASRQPDKMFEKLSFAGGGISPLAVKK